MPPKPAIAIVVSDPSPAQALDIDALAAALAKLSGVAGLWRSADLGAGLEELAQAVGEGRADRVLWLGRVTPAQRETVAARLRTAGLNPHLLAWLDLEGEGALPAGLAPEARRKKALVLVKMRLAELRLAQPLRSEERRVGKECRRLCRSRWSPYH
jgi:heterodisulfide reductase subunit A-like polyferredoxin